MSEDLIKIVQKLIDSGKGDSKRLHDIFNILKQETPLYLSDYKYIENLNKSIEEEQQQIFAQIEKDKSKNKGRGKKSNTIKKAEKTQSKGDSSLRILKNRLAAGEISIDEFNDLKKVLKNN